MLVLERVELVLVREGSSSSGIKHECYNALPRHYGIVMSPITEALTAMGVSEWPLI